MSTLHRQVIIDVRDVHHFTEGHLPEAAHFEGEEDLKARSAELPEPTVRRMQGVLVVAPDEDFGKRVSAILLEYGFRSAEVWDVGNSKAPPQLVQTPPCRLWAPSAMAVRAEALARELGLPKNALDVGCGTGRDAAYLASRGWNVTGVERCPKLASRAEQLATRRYAGDVDERDRGTVRAIVRTLGAHTTEDSAWMRDNAASLVLVVRFLRRSVLHLLRQAVPPGGLLAYEHFLDGCEEFGSPMNPAQRLRHGELARVFGSEHGFTILVDEVAHLLDGRPIARFIARRDTPE